MKPISRKFALVAVLVILACLAALILGTHDKGPFYSGKSMEYWEQQARIRIQQGDFETTILPAVQKMGPQTVPFWLKRLQTKDSIFTRSYSKLWSSLPTQLEARLPVPITQRARRNVASVVLSNMYTTNEIPELIQLSYSKDPELQYYAVCLLWKRAFCFYEPSTECIAAFCSALKTGNVDTRLWAVRGLNILPFRHEALPSLQLALNDNEEEVRIVAATAIIKLQPNSDLNSDLSHIFQTGINSSNSNVRSISRVTLEQLERLKKAKPLVRD